MAGAASNFFTQKKQQYEQIAAQAQTATGKVNAANQALALLAKPTLTQAEAETLIALHDASI
jgi:hypothetical protein